MKRSERLSISKLEILLLRFKMTKEMAGAKKEKRKKMPNKANFNRGSNK
jgi:hypothetical protein